MVDITPLITPEQKLIQSYAAGAFRVNGQVFSHPILVMGETVSEWKCGDNPLLLSDDVRALKGRVDVLLIGMGNAGAPPLPPSKRAAFTELGMSVEIMDTPSACRTYNVLTAEGRRVAAAIMPV